MLRGVGSSPASPSGGVEQNIQAKSSRTQSETATPHDASRACAQSMSPLAPKPSNSQTRSPRVKAHLGWGERLFAADR